MLRRLIPLFFVFPLFMSAQVWASQHARVTSIDAVVHAKPSDESFIVEHYKEGTILEISSTPYNGFYRVRLTSQTTGYIHVSDVDTYYEKGRTVDLEKTGIPPRFRYSLNLSAGFANTSYGDLLPKFGLQSSDLNPNWEMSAEIQLHVNRTNSFGIRVTRLQSKAVALTPSAGDLLTVTSTQVPIELGWIHSLIDSRNYELRFGLYAGASINSTHASQTSVGDVYYSSTNFAATLALPNIFWIGDRTSIVVEPAYRFQTPSLTQNTTYFGNAYQISYSAVYLSAGLTWYIP